MNSFKRSLGLTFLITSLLVAAWAVIFQVVLPESVWENCESPVSYCEAICENSHQCPSDKTTRQVVQQPINTWTNVIFLVVGLFVATRKLDVGSIVFLLSNVYGFVASFLFHASVTVFWEAVDLANVYTCVLAMLGQALYATFHFSWNKIAIMVLVGGILASTLTHGSSKAFLGIQNAASLFGLLAVAVILITGIVLGIAEVRSVRNIRAERATSKERRKSMLFAFLSMLLPLLFMGGGVVCMLFDTKRLGLWCNPDEFLQGHALWHILAGIAYYLGWQGFERNRREHGDPSPSCGDDSDRASNEQDIESTGCTSQGKINEESSESRKMLPLNGEQTKG